jgi:general secretion pathway protein G
MVIIGLLASYVGPRFFAQVGKSEVTVAKAQVDALSRALDTFRLDTGRYPSTEEGLGVLMAPPGDNAAGRWNGPYLQKAVPLDPWGRPYLYKNPGTGKAFDVFSLGKDGQVGGTGENADINN